MKFFLMILSVLALSACVMVPLDYQNPRSTPSHFNDTDALEELMLSEPALIESYRSLKSDDDLTIGMPKQKVSLHLGSPDQVEVAGNPKYENERWVYERSVPTVDGYYKETKVIYFEAGSVVGWEQR